MKLREIFRYEFGYRLRSGSTWAYAAILFLLAIWAFLATADGGGTHVNTPERLAEGALLVSMFGLLVSAAIFGDAAVRDSQTRMDPLLYTSPLRKAEYLGGHFLAALAINGLVLVAIPLGLLAATLLPVHDPADVGPLRFGAYAQPWLLFLLPNLVLIGAVLYATGVLSRKVIPVYLAGIGIFIAFLRAADSPLALSAVGDPIGFGMLQEMTRYWTEAERNTRLIGFPADVVASRAFWLAVAAVVLGLLHHRFRFAHPDGGRRWPWRRRRRVIAQPESERATPVAVPRVVGSFELPDRVRQTLAVARNSLAEAAASRWFLVVLIACAGLTLLMGWNVGSTVFDTSTWPVTLLVAGTVLSERIVPIIYILVVLYAGELVWKDREVGVAEITDAAPIPEAAALAGRFLALVAMLTLILAATMLGGVLIQAFQGYYDFELGLYLRVLGLNLTGYVLVAALAMTIHVVVNHKYLGHIMVLLVFLSTAMLPAMGIIEHHLLLYGTDPGWTYSDMNGFGPYIGPVAWFKLYWAAWALLLGVIAVLSWVRGPELGIRRRLRKARGRLTQPVVRTAAGAIVLIGLLGGFIFYNTNVLNEYRPTHERGAPQAEYEKRYAHFEHLPQPTITAAEVRVEIYPDAPAVDLRGSYMLVNRTDTPIDSVHVSFMDRDLQTRSISFDRVATSVLVDDEVQYRIYELERALGPGESLQLRFDVGFRPRGFPNDGIQTDVVANGTNFNRKWLPFIGYQPLFELTGDEARARFDLEPQPPTPGPEDAERQLRQPWRDADNVHVEMIIGTAADQIAVTPGVLRRSWREDGRRYFHFETAAPTSFGATVISAEYAVLEDRWNDVALQILHHPSHTDNLDRMLRSMKASLEYFTREFGPYPDAQLRIVEIPRYGGFGIAHPHTVAFTEDAFFSRVREGEVDQPFYGTAHEIAHQWWGGLVRGARVRGAGFLSESLANYSAMMVTEKTYGTEAARRVYEFQMERYFRGRATQSREVPVLQVEDQPYIAYRRGAVGLYMLREQIGEERVNTALRRYADRYRDSGPPYPTSLDLFAELRAVTPDSLQGLLSDLFETVTLWDVRTESAVVEPTGTGEYVVTLDVIARKVRADSVGNESEVPMDDVVEIGVFAPRADSDEADDPGEPLYLERHRIRSGEQSIRITVPREPARAGIDPYRKLIDRQRRDNVVDLEAAGADAVEPSTRTDP